MKYLPAAVLVLLSFIVPAAAQDAPPTLAATGTGMESAAPDMAVVTLGVLSRAGTAREALDENNAEMDKVVQMVRGQAVADKDISTTGFSINPVYSRPSQVRSEDQPVEPKVVAYEVTNQIRIIVRDIDKTGTVIDSAVTAGANQAGSINFDIQDRQALVDKAIAEAIAEARRKAGLMAEAAGVRLVRVLNISANEGGGGPVFRLETRAAAAPAVPVMGGELSISANAQISWEIAPK